MNIKIEINGDNAAFFHGDHSVNFGEYARIMRVLAGQVGSGEYEDTHAKIRDINGNVCGYIQVSD